MSRPGLLPRCAPWLFALTAVSPELLAAQRATVGPLLPARAATRIALPEVLAVSADSQYTLLLPALYEPRALYRTVAGEWTIAEPVFRRDSLRAARSVVGKAVGLYIDGVAVGTGRVRQVQAGLCDDPPAWCPTRATVEVVGGLTRSTPPIVALSPPPTHSAETMEPTDDEVGAASRALLAVFRMAAGRRQPIREEQMSTPVVFAINDVDNARRVLVAGGSYDLGGAGALSGVVVGIAADTLLRAATGRARRLAPGINEELRSVSAFDLNGDGRDEVLCGWVSGGDWQFEILSPDRLGRFSQQWRGPDRSPPPARPRR